MAHGDMLDSPRKKKGADMPQSAPPRGERGFPRREFLKKTAATTVALPLVVSSSTLGIGGQPPPSDRILMGCIGVGGRGSGNMRGFMGHRGVRVVAVCDVVKGRRDDAKKRVDQHNGDEDCATYVDYRELCARDDIDAVSIATPDHWHALPSIEACRRGKHVFCEKPLSLTIREGRAMVEAARRYDRVFSCGSQRVLGDYGKLARYIRSGAIGEVKEAYVSVGGPSRPCNLPPQPVPDDVDWEMWLGPAPWVPFNRGRLNFRPWRDYSGGGMTDWGGHKFGAVLFAMDLQTTGPVEVIPPRGKDPEFLTYRFASGFRMYHSPGKGDVTYVGTKGEASRRNMGPPAREVEMPGYKGGRGLQGDFLHCVRTGERPFRDVEFGHRAATVCHLGNIAYRLERPLRWDPEKEEIVGDDEANRQVDRSKREPWRL
jgi:predicted dehydrogenase